MSPVLTQLLERLEQAFPPPTWAPGVDLETHIYQSGAARAVAKARHLAENPE